MRMDKETAPRGAVSGNVRPGESIELETSDGRIRITLVAHRGNNNGEPARSVIRVEASKSVSIALPRNTPRGRFLSLFKGESS